MYGNIPIHVCYCYDAKSVFHTGVNPSYVMHWSIKGGVTFINTK